MPLPLQPRVLWVMTLVVLLPLLGALQLHPLLEALAAVKNSARLPPAVLALVLLQVLSLRLVVVVVLLLLHFHVLSLAVLLVPHLLLPATAPSSASALPRPHQSP